MSAATRDRAILLGGLTALAGLAWGYLVSVAPAAMMAGGHMGVVAENVRGMALSGASSVGLPFGTGSRVTAAAPLFATWAVTMVAIMIPSTVPAALLVDAAERRQGAAYPLARTLAFLAGCTAAWLLFSIVAALAHLGLSESSMLSPAMSMTSPSLAGGLLVLAGMFQWSPLKTRCLRGTRRQPGSAGSVLTGLQHGLFSVGCGWALIALLFVAGVMNLLWVAALAVFVLLEGTRIGERASRAAGALLTVAGALLLTSGLGV